MVLHNFKNIIYVFGANESGRHNKGLAEFACKYKGAIQGEGYGIKGQSFAIPTTDIHQQKLPLNQIKNYVDSFIHYANNNPQLFFQINKIGCVDNEYRHSDVAPLFKNCPDNCILSGIWSRYLFDSESRIIINIDSSINDENFVFNKINNLLSNIQNKKIIVHNNSNPLINKYCKDNNLDNVIFPIDKDLYSTIQYSYIKNIDDLIWYGSHLVNIFESKDFFYERFTNLAKKENIPLRNIDYNKRRNTIL
jgi:hypothetical protein